MRDAAFDYLAQAESTLLRFQDSELISDEAELLRGCLAALVSIARQTYDAAAPRESESLPELPEYQSPNRAVWPM